MTKLTDADFDRFKAECLKLQGDWGLQEYSLYFGRCTDADSYASVSIDEEGCVVRIKLTKSVKDIEEMPPIEVLAKHEMIHLMINRLVWVGGRRWVTEGEIDNEWERLTVKLEKLL